MDGDGLRLIDPYPEEGKGAGDANRGRRRDGKSMAPSSSSSDIYRLPKEDSVLSGHPEGYTKPYPRLLPRELEEGHVG